MRLGHLRCRDHEGARRRPPARSGFTLLEVLVAVAVMATLIALLAPALGRSRHLARGAVCLSNLRQMLLASSGYQADNAGRYAPYLYKNPLQLTSYGWDLILVSSSDGTTAKVLPGLIWQGRTIPEINQCPSYQGSDNWIAYPYTGYNYNTSFVGWCVYSPEFDASWQLTGRLIAEENPARDTDIRQPGRCAVFGDGEYAGGANKFMRSPLPGRDQGVFSNRHAGTQGYRHLGRTNVAFADGHAEPRLERYTGQSQTGASGSAEEGVAAGTGFLSADNRMYSLSP